MRGLESCSDADLESHSHGALSPLNQAAAPMNQSQGLSELMDSDGGSGAEEGGEAFQDKVMEEYEGGEGDFGMGQVSGGEGDDKGAESDSNYSEDLDLDNKIKLGGLSDSEDGLQVGDNEFDDWKAFDEEEENEADCSDEDALREFEEMMGNEEYAELWSTHWYSLCSVLPLFNDIFSYRK